MLLTIAMMMMMTTDVRAEGRRVIDDDAHRHRHRYHSRRDDAANAMTVECVCVLCVCERVFFIYGRYRGDPTTTKNAGKMASQIAPEYRVCSYKLTADNNKKQRPYNNSSTHAHKVHDQHVRASVARREKRCDLKQPTAPLESRKIFVQLGYVLINCWTAAGGLVRWVEENSQHQQ